MSSILIVLFTLVLVIVCLLLILVILMQRPNANSGMGAALGGGAAEGIFGGEAGNVLTKATVKLTVLFFVISAGLYFGYIYSAKAPDATAPQNLSITSAIPDGKKSAEPASASKQDAATKSNPAAADTKAGASEKNAQAAKPAAEEKQAQAGQTAKSAMPENANKPAAQK